ncbi:unnamed protein product [Camellia sinensis]
MCIHRRIHRGDSDQRRWGNRGRRSPWTGRRSLWTERPKLDLDFGFGDFDFDLILGLILDFDFDFDFGFGSILFSRSSRTKHINESTSFSVSKFGFLLIR